MYIFAAAGKMLFPSNTSQLVPGFKQYKCWDKNNYFRIKARINVLENDKILYTISHVYGFFKLCPICSFSATMISLRDYHTEQANYPADWRAAIVLIGLLYINKKTHRLISRLIAIAIVQFLGKIL